MSTTINVQTIEAPNLSGLFGGELDIQWREALALVLTNCRDLSRPHDSERSIAFAIKFRSQPDRQSCLYEMAGAVKITIAAPPPPRASRMAWREGVAGALVIRLNHGAKAREGVVLSEDIGVDQSLLMAIDDEALGLQYAFERELARILLNISDLRTEVRALRKLRICVTFTPDEDRGAVTPHVKKCAAELALRRSQKVRPLYIKEAADGRIGLAHEPTALLPGNDDGAEPLAGRQASLGDDDHEGVN